ncbi:MAG: septum formation protein Maf [Deltaproteobacteria bacterium]|nr:septum formation protein Maf [Deltaproteobacteria bacterium]
MTLVLASGSPRRRQLLEWAGYALSIQVPEVDERILAGESPVAYAERLAAAKGQVDRSGAVRVAADTVVHLDGVVLDKPRDRAEVVAHLRALSGRWHKVTTGFYVGTAREGRAASVTTEVRFRALGEAEIQRYAQSGEGDDKAGAYGIQGLGGALVAELRGSWTNVMGLPLEEVLTALHGLEQHP